MGDEFMDIWKECIDEALLSLQTDDVPIGAIIVDSMGNFVEKGHNTFKQNLKKAYFDNVRP